MMMEVELIMGTVKKEKKMKLTMLKSSVYDYNDA